MQKSTAKKKKSLILTLLPTKYHSNIAQYVLLISNKDWCSFQYSLNNISYVLAARFPSCSHPDRVYSHMEHTPDTVKGMLISQTAFCRKLLNKTGKKRKI